MKVRMRTLMAGEHGVTQPGEIVDVDRKTARALLESKQAVLVKDVSVRKAVVKTEETATLNSL